MHTSCADRPGPAVAILADAEPPRLPLPSAPWATLPVMRIQRIAGLALVAALLVPAGAGATNCRTWQRLGPDQKSAQVERMIQRTISGSGGRAYRVQRGSVERCLRGAARDIEYEFDDACSDPRSAGMNALDRIFKKYVWSCVG